MKKIRNSNFELLRIIAMIMIIGLHYMNRNMGGVIGEIIPGTLNYYIVHFFESLFIIAVNLFIILTGYFFVDKTDPKISKVIKLMLIAYFYGAFFYIISIAFGNEKFSLIMFIKQINPLLMGNYWFVSIYIILYILSPYINILINKLSEKTHKSFIVLMLIFFSMWPSFLPYGPSNDRGYGIISFILLYNIGAYIRKYLKVESSSCYYFSIFLSCILITFIFSLIKGPWDYWAYNFIFNISAAVSLFLCFSKLNIRSIRINNFAKFTFAIYIIHINPVIIKFVFKDMLKCYEFYNSKFLFIHMIFSILIMYVISLLIELCRLYIVKMIKYIVSIKLLESWRNIQNRIDVKFLEFFY